MRTRLVNPLRRRVAMSILAILACVDVAPAGSEEKLVAPIYPGSFRLSPAQTKGRDRIVFASRDAHEKVQAFYLTKGTHLAKGDEGEFSGQKNTETIIVYTYEQVLRIIKQAKGDYTEANPAEVFLEWRGPEANKNLMFDRFFRKLEEQTKKHPGHDAELSALRQQYGWLLGGFAIDDKVKAVFEPCSQDADGTPAAIRDPKAAQEFYAQLKQLAQEGRWEEYHALNNKVMGSSEAARAKRAADQFGLWRKCLTDASAFGYVTRISIHQDPSLWSY